MFKKLVDLDRGRFDLKGIISWGQHMTPFLVHILNIVLLLGKDFREQIIYYIDSNCHKQLFAKDKIHGLLRSILLFNDEIIIAFWNKKIGIKATNYSYK